MTVDLYKILEVSPNASPKEIKGAYRRLAHKYHPDHNPGNAELEERFKHVTMAYEILSDPSKRAQYDQFGTVRPSGDIGFDRFGSVADIFEFFFGGGFGGGPFASSRRRPRDPAYSEGEDIVETITFELKDVLTEQQVTIKARRLEVCPECHGSRAEPGTHPTTCQQCRGTGMVSSTRQTLLGVFSTAAPCPVCRGSGQIIESPCKACRGTGVTARDRVVDVTIPAGVADGTVMRLAGNGNAGTGGGRNGDMLIRVRVKPDPVFEVDGPDLLAKLPMAYPELVLGAEVVIQHLSGENIRVKVPQGTQPGDVISLRSRGLPRLTGGGSGDLHLQVELDMPRKLKQEERRILTSLLELNGKKGMLAGKPRELRKPQII
ncbi:J domain-containing protein [bacterium]|nr:J domain-containing protein [bacterium]